MDSYYAELSASGVETVRFEGLSDLDCLCIGKDGIEGWYSTPTPKVSATARGQGDGGHDVSEDGIIYASRTVTLHWNANASTRQSLLELTNRVRRFVHRHVRLRVVDGIEDTYCEQGYLSMVRSRSIVKARSMIPKSPSFLSVLSVCLRGLMMVRLVRRRYNPAA